jgi:hypothetical protein
MFLCILMLTALVPALAADSVAPAQRPDAVTLEQILGGESCMSEAAATSSSDWCYPSIHCSTHDDCDAFCGDPAFGYCEWNRCCSCLG